MWGPAVLISAGILIGFAAGLAAGRWAFTSEDDE